MKSVKIGLLGLIVMNGAIIFAGPVFSSDAKPAELTREERHKELQLKQETVQDIFDKLTEETPENKKIIADQAHILYRMMKDRKSNMCEQDFSNHFHTLLCSSILSMRTSKGFTQYFPERSTVLSGHEAEGDN